MDICAFRLRKKSDSSIASTRLLPAGPAKVFPMRLYVELTNIRVRLSLCARLMGELEQWLVFGCTAIGK